MLLFLAGQGGHGRPASHELNELPPSLSAVTALHLGGTAL